jgi:hypothetical protein
VENRTIKRPWFVVSSEDERVKKMFGRFMATECIAGAVSQVVAISTAAVGPVRR